MLIFCATDRSCAHVCRNALAVQQSRVDLHPERRPVLRITVRLALVLEAVRQARVERLRRELRLLRIRVERLEDALADPVCEVFCSHVEDVRRLPRGELRQHRGLVVVEARVVDLDVRMRLLEGRNDLLEQVVLDLGAHPSVERHRRHLGRPELLRGVRHRAADHGLRARYEDHREQHYGREQGPDRQSLTHTSPS